MANNGGSWISECEETSLSDEENSGTARVVEISDSEDEPANTKNRDIEVHSVAKRMGRVQIATTSPCNVARRAKTLKKDPESKAMFIDVESPVNTEDNPKAMFRPMIVNGKVRTGLPNFKAAAIVDDARTETPHRLPKFRPTVHQEEENIKTPRAPSKSTRVSGEPGASTPIQQGQVKNAITNKIIDQIQRYQGHVDIPRGIMKERKIKLARVDAMIDKRIMDNQDPFEEDTSLPTPPLPRSVIDQVSFVDSAGSRSMPWFATDTDEMFARFLIDKSRNLSEGLCREVEEYAKRFNVAYGFIHKNKTRGSNEIPQRARTENLSINHRTVLSMAEVRLQLLKVFDAVMALVRSTDLSTPNVLTRLYEYNNVLVVQTAKHRETGDCVSTLLSGRAEDLSFLSFLILAHYGDSVEKLRDPLYLPHVHQDLRDRWVPEVLYDEELANRILGASFPTVTTGPTTFVMVPLAEMRLDRTKIITQRSTNGCFDFVVDIIPLKYNDLLEAYLGLERK